jgi:hypothetical protein
MIKDYEREPKKLLWDAIEANLNIKTPSTKIRWNANYWILE